MAEMKIQVSHLIKFMRECLIEDIKIVKAKLPERYGSRAQPYVEKTQELIKLFNGILFELLKTTSTYQSLAEDSISLLRVGTRIEFQRRNIEKIRDFFHDEASKRPILASDENYNVFLNNLDEKVLKYLKAFNEFERMEPTKGQTFCKENIVVRESFLEAVGLGGHFKEKVLPAA